MIRVNGAIVLGMGVAIPAPHVGLPVGIKASQRIVPDGVRFVQTGPDVALAVEAESIPDPCSRIERRTRNRGVRYGDVATRRVEVEKVLVVLTQDAWKRMDFEAHDAGNHRACHV